MSAVVILTKVLHLSSFIKNFVLDFLLKSVIIKYDLSPFRLSICVQSTEAFENLFFFSFNTCYQLAFF
jgi:hypothetical protein